MRTSGWLVPAARAIAVVAILATALPSGTPASSATAPEQQSAQTSNIGLPAAVTPTGSLTQATTIPIATPTVSDRLARAQQTAPLTFVENVGQFDSQLRFQVRPGEATIWLADDAIWITILDKPVTPTVGLSAAFGSSSEPGPQQSKIRPPTSGSPSTPAAPTHGTNMKLTFPGANPHPVLEPLNRQSSHVSYFTGGDSTKWRPDVPVWGGVRYRSMFPGIDLEITGDGGQWIWRLVTSTATATGSARPSGQDLAQSLPRVQLRVEGADRTTLDAKYLHLDTPAGELTLPLFGTSTAPFPSSAAIAGSGSDVRFVRPDLQHLPGRE